LGAIRRTVTDMTETVERPGAVAVIGAGPHGLTALKSLLAHGIPADGFDRADGVGGNWRFGAPTSRVYESTHLISSKPFTQFPDFPMPDGYPDYPSHRQVLAYFERYAEHFGVGQRYLFNTEVVDVREVADAPAGAFGGLRWDVTIRRIGGDTTTGPRGADAGNATDSGTTPTTTLRYDAVVIANGHNWHPKFPSYPGLDDFAGEVLHSADYKSADQLRGRRVLVVGAGNTGCDIAVESAQNAAATYHSTRRAYWYNPKYALGRPSDQVADRLLAFKLPIRVRRSMYSLMHKVIVGDYTRYGLREPDHAFYETHPVVNQNLIYYIGHGDIDPRSDVASFDADGATFSDGSRAEVDVVVFATGYLARFDFLADPHVLGLRDGRPHLGLQMASPTHTNVWLSGLIQPDSGQWAIAHWQGETIATFLALAQGDPARAENIHREILAEADRRFTGGADYKESTRHFYEIAHQDYLEALGHLLGQIRGAARDRRATVGITTRTVGAPG
jgi:hypothetical protein